MDRYRETRWALVAHRVARFLWKHKWAPRTEDRLWRWAIAHAPTTDE